MSRVNSLARRRFTHWIQRFLQVGALVGGSMLLCAPVWAGGYARGEYACSGTAKAAFNACKAEITDDFWIAVGNCRNLEERGEQRDCNREAWQELLGNRKECGEQLEGRRDVCEALGEAPYQPEIDPENFSGPINNPYLPLIPGSWWRYEGDGEEILVEVTDETKEIMGVTCTVVRDRVYEDGEIVEDTFDWFAQDDDGNVWYFGELSQEYENGELVSLEGSWEAGKDDAQPGILMLANPQVEDVYRQEFFLGDAEDMAKVVALGEDTTIGLGDFVTLVTEEWTPIEPDVRENKYYAMNIGTILERKPDTGEQVELVEYFIEH